MSNSPGEWGEFSGVLLSDVRELFMTLGKALRAYRLYEENNPVYQRFLGSLREAFRKVWGHEERLTVTVEESRLLVNTAEVYASGSRSDSLAFLLFKDGIREVTFFEGLEEAELERFLGVLHRARHVGPQGDDLLTILWEEELEFFRYHYVDLLAEGVEIPEPGKGASADRLHAVLEDEMEPEAGEEDKPAEARAAEAPAKVSQEGFNPTLYSLDPREMELLQREIELEMTRDLRTDVLTALFDRLEERGRPGRQSEVLSIFRQLLPNFLGRGALEAAARVLEELRSLESRPEVFDEERAAQVADLVDELSAPETVDELVRALEDGSISPAPRQLSDFLTHLRAGALGPLVRASETISIKELQPVLQEAVKGIAGRNRHVLVDLLSNADPVVVSGAIRLVGRLQVTEAAPALQDLLRHPEPAVRLAAVDAALTLRASIVAGALQDALADPEREVRIAAARTLGKLRYRPAAARFRSVISGKELRSADLSEKIAFFESYGELGDQKAVDLLDRLLNGKGLLGRREPVEIRACAALALGKVGTAEAMTALRRANRDDDPVVKSAVNRALRTGAETE